MALHLFEESGTFNDKSFRLSRQHNQIQTEFLVFRSLGAVYTDLLLILLYLLLNQIKKRM